MKRICRDLPPIHCFFKMIDKRKVGKESLGGCGIALRGQYVSMSWWSTPLPHFTLLWVHLAPTSLGVLFR
jgi:hypothetical protein